MFELDRSVEEFKHPCQVASSQGWGSLVHGETW